MDPSPCAYSFSDSTVNFVLAFPFFCLVENTMCCLFYIRVFAHSITLPPNRKRYSKCVFSKLSTRTPPDFSEYVCKI